MWFLTLVILNLRIPRVQIPPPSVDWLAYEASDSFGEVMVLVLDPRNSEFKNSQGPDPTSFSCVARSMRRAILRGGGGFVSLPL